MSEAERQVPVTAEGFAFLVPDRPGQEFGHV